jgi:hypothetical protein
MISPHPVFNPPENEDQIIWRYLDFTKLVSLLDSSELYFPRADQFDDKFEGSTPRPLAIGRDLWGKQMVSDGKLRPMYAESNVLGEGQKRSRGEKGVNCWHMNDQESAAMWKLYLKSDEGIAIRSTYKRLFKCLNESKYNLNIGTVKYIDYEKEGFPLNNGLYPFLHKRKSFEHENELRAIIWFKEGNNSKLLTKVDLTYGIGISVDLAELIESIFVSPYAPRWFHDLVESVVKKYNVSTNIHYSKINESPIY